MRSWVPTRLWVPPSSARALATSDARITVPHHASPHGATRTTSVRLGLVQWPSIGAGPDAAAGTAAARRNNAVFARMDFIGRVLAVICGKNRAFSLLLDEQRN